MDLKQTIKKLEKNNAFSSWKDRNKHTYFSYAFKIPQEMKNDEWQIGFYNRDKDKITTFTITGDDVGIRHEEEMFKKEETKVKEIKIDNVKLSFDDVLSKATEFQQENYPKDKALKTIVILQNSDEFGDVWNVTFITEPFNTLNMKIDASDGKIKHHKISSIFSFRQE